MVYHIQITINLVLNCMRVKKSSSVRYSRIEYMAFCSCSSLLPHIELLGSRKKDYLFWLQQNIFRSKEIHQISI